jgi:hypothetical protein
MFNRFPSKTPHLLFFFLLVRAACMASETVRCFGDGNYPRDLTNFFGHSFLAFANGIGSKSGLGLEKEMGWMIFQSSMGVLFWSASSCVRPRLLTPSRFVFYVYNEFFYISIFRSRSKYLRSFLGRMRRWMGRMEEEKTRQNETIECHTHYLHIPFDLKALLCLLGDPGLHPRLYACMYVRMHTVQYSRSAS